MPTYEFRCPNGHEFERFFRKMSDAASELPCPECGAVAGRQLSAGAGLLFKGSGFYLTDYGKNAHRKTGPSVGGKAGQGEGKGEGEGKGKGEGKGESAAAGGESKATDAKPADASGSKGAEKSTSPPKASGSGGGEES
jgi:putative FmdB family regulatory protein